MKLLLSISLLGLLLVGGAFAQEKAEYPPAVEKQSPAKNKNDLPITAEREAAVMTFVQQNHAELRELLNHLRDNRRKDYERAIRELSRDAERIGQLKARDGKQYELEIQAWTIKSRIQLLTAHLAMGDKEEIRSQLRSLLNEQMDVRSAVLKRERERAQDRLIRIEQDLSRLENDRQKIVENQLRVLTKSAADSKNKVKVTKSGPRPGNKKPAKPTVNQPDK
ncbi:MAG: hypothetical protein IAF94_00305 [Pirellulaceae bacterium]|nr:hypothetical protein [Pirellulaceae bacterium]